MCSVSYKFKVVDDLITSSNAYNEDICMILDLCLITQYLCCNCEQNLHFAIPKSCVAGSGC